MRANKCMWFSKQAESPACIATENRIAEALQSLVLLVQSAFSPIVL